MIRESTKNRVDGLVASDLKLRSASMQPLSLMTGSRQAHAASGRRPSNCGAAWSLAHTNIASPN